MEFSLLCCTSSFFKSTPFLLYNMFKAIDLGFVLISNFVNFNEEQLMEKIVNLIVNFKIWIFLWAVIHPPLVNPVINIVLVHKWFSFLDKASYDRHSEIVNNIVGRFSLQFFPCLHHLFLEISKQLFSDMLLLMIDNNFHVDVRLNVSIFPENWYSSILLIFSLFSNRFIISLTISLTNFRCISDIEQV